MRLSLRPASESDAGRNAGIYAVYVEATAVSFGYAPPSSEEKLSRIRRIRGRFPFLVGEADRKTVAYAYADEAFSRTAYRWCAELSVYVDPAFRHRGVGKKLTGCVEEICRRLGYRKLYALITGENAASLAFHRAVGYADCARFSEQGYKFGRWLDVYWLEKTLNGKEVAASFPRKFPELDGGELESLLAEHGGEV